MNTFHPRLIDELRRVKVLVIGEAMLDCYLEGSSSRICREAPVPIVDVTSREDVPGGAGNTAANIASLGGQVSLLSVVGEDQEGALIRTRLAAGGVDTANVIATPMRRTLAKHRVVAASQLMLRFDQGSVDPLDYGSERMVGDRLGRLFRSHDAVVISDYGYGLMTSRVVRLLVELQLSAPRVVVVDSRNLLAYRSLGPTAVKPNYEEAARLLGIERVDGPDARARQIAEHGSRLLELTGAQLAAITLDSDGAIVFEHGSPPYRTYAKPMRNTQAAGAGDTFVAALSTALAAGASSVQAVELASTAAAVVVGKDGTSVCSANDVREHTLLEQKYLGDVDLFARRIAFDREQGRRIVFTNGCFDILHRGHIAYLNRAKALGDILVVGLNSDESVARLKGPSRPINSLEDRVEVLGALSCVDYIVPFDDDTPSELIKRIRPHVFVKGGDYTRDTLPEAGLVEALGGQVHLLPYMEDRSTTGLIERIRKAAVDRAGRAEAGTNNREHGQKRTLGRRGKHPVR